jgi:hypothetical protein
MSAAALPFPPELDREPPDGAREPSRPARARSRKWVASILSLVLLGAVIAPVGQNWMAAPQDDFPLSYYPMFSFDKTDRQRVTYLIAHDADGRRLLLPYWFAGLGGMNQVRRQMTKLVERGESSRLCRSVAARVARAEDLPKNLVNVQVVTGTFFMSEFFTGNRMPTSENVRAHCAIQRG